MNAKRIVLLSCVAALALPVSVATGQSRGGGRAQVGSMPARSAPTFTRSAPSGTSRNWSGGNWSGDWRHHRFSRDRFIFIDTFGFPFFYGYPYYGYYPYDYYGYGYDPYGSYSPYGSDYYGGSGYGDGNGNGSSVVQLQRRLARAGYYHGAIDGIMGPATRRAIRAYERTHNPREYGMTDRY
jgi:Putative peptidoglycan binding domain